MEPIPTDREHERQPEMESEQEPPHASLRRRIVAGKLRTDGEGDSSAGSEEESSELEVTSGFQDRNGSDRGEGEDERKTGTVVNGGICVESNGKEGDEGRGGRDGKGESQVRYMCRPAAPAHRRVKESPLSSDSIFRQSHAGLFNLCIVVLVAVNSRLIIENLMKYGLLIRTGFWFSSKSLRDWPLLMCCLTLPLFPMCSFSVEKIAQHKLLSEPFIILLHVAICTASILCPILVILRFDSAVLSGITLMLLSCIIWLKLVSYAHTNHDLRLLSYSTNKEDNSCNYLNVDGPYTLSFKCLVYFMVAPTLCYQLTYPRTSCIRKSYVIRQSFKLVIFTGVMGFIVEQYINPIVKNSQHPLKGNFLYAVERVLKLSVPTLYVWLCMFYCFFHLWLNILAELLRFGDREFYKDWWNAKTIEEYWRMWNMPVHRWMVRHIYFPCLRNGLSKTVAVLIAFLMSAVFHELHPCFCFSLYFYVVQLVESVTRHATGFQKLCVAVPCHIFKFWAFLGILFQVPLVILTSYLQQKFQNDMKPVITGFVGVGNIIFWSFFSIFGQPMCVLLYYHDVMNRKIRT